MLHSLNDIKHGFYINLIDRPDRKKHIEDQLRKLGLEVGIERFNAIKLQQGAIGCSMSHLKCIELAKERNWEYVLVMEDDIVFLNPQLFTRQLNIFLQNKIKWDVILFAGNNMPPFVNIDSTCIRVSRCQTATGYLVQRHYFDTLINNFKSGIKLLLQNPSNRGSYAIDRYWFRLQARDLWFLIIPLSVIQRDDYSNIEKKNVTYGKMMMSIDKRELMTDRKDLIIKNSMKELKFN